MQKRVAGRNTIILFVILAVVAATSAPGIAAQSTDPTMVRVIVEGSSLQDAIAAVHDNGGAVLAELGVIRAVSAIIPRDRLAHLDQTPTVVRITPDRAVRASGERVDVEFNKAIGADEVWQAGVLGEGITVAVLDSGIDPTFGELRRPPRGGGNRLLAYVDVLNGETFEGNRVLRSPRDPHGHGTHVAGIIGNSEYERFDAEFRGVAPASNLVAVRVLDETGVGSYSDVIQGIDWVVRHKDSLDIRVLNVSLYAPAVAPYWADPLNLATMAAWNAGIVVVTSAGNGGPAPMSIGVPGNSPYVITVGTFTDNYTPGEFGDDYIPPFSGTGPTLDGFVKPDLIAPGAHIGSLAPRRAYLRAAYPDNQINGRYFQMSGTSMSAAVVSGIVALMLSENPNLSPNQVKYRLAMTARPQFSEYNGEAAYSIWEQGAGRVWAADAVFSDVGGEANQGMDLDGDLIGTVHYQGWTTFDLKSGEFRIMDGGYNAWAGGYNAWAGGYHAWAGGYSAWAGGTTNWSGAFNDWVSAYGTWVSAYNAWAGEYQAWAGAYNAWAGGYSAWAGGYSAWAGGYSAWAGGYSAWAGGYSAWAGCVGDPDWAEGFAKLEHAPTATSSVGVNVWVGEE